MELDYIQEQLLGFSEGEERESDILPWTCSNDRLRIFVLVGLAFPLYNSLQSSSIGGRLNEAWFEEAWGNKTNSLSWPETISCWYHPLITAIDYHKRYSNWKNIFTMFIWRTGPISVNIVKGERNEIVLSLSDLLTMTHLAPGCASCFATN